LIFSITIVFTESTDKIIGFLPTKRREAPSEFEATTTFDNAPILVGNAEGQTTPAKKLQLKPTKKVPDIIVSYMQFRSNCLKGDKLLRRKVIQAQDWAIFRAAFQKFYSHHSAA
jgi:hypothetical protein